MDLRETCDLLTCMRPYNFILFCGGVSSFEKLLEFGGVHAKYFTRKGKKNITKVAKDEMLLYYINNPQNS